MTGKLLIFSFLILFGLARAESSNSDVVVFSNEYLEVKFSSPEKNENNEWVIRSSIRNIGGKPLEINQNFLPWASRWSLDLMGISISPTPKIVQPAIYIDDTRLGSIVLPAGEERFGEIKINKFFVEFTGELSKNSICICYRYPLRQLINGSSELIEFCALIPRNLTTSPSIATIPSGK